MKSRHIAIFNLPVPVHVNPTLSIVSSLVRRGHSVTYVTSSTFDATISTLGASVIHCPRLEAPRGNDRKHHEKDADKVCNDLLEFAEITYREALPFFENEPPDLILYDPFMMTGNVFSAKQRAPAVRLTPHLAYDLEGLNEPNVPESVRLEILSLSSIIDHFYQRHGLTEKGSLFKKEDLNIYPYIKEFQLDGASVNDRDFYAPRCAPERPMSRVWRPKVDSDRPTILISASSSIPLPPLKYYRMCLEAATNLSCRALLAIGDNTDPGVFEPLPPGCEIVQGIPQLLVMPYVDVVISTSSLVVATEALYYGAPLILISHGISLAGFYAGIVAHAGGGFHLNQADISVEEIENCLRRLVEGRVLEHRVGSLRKLIRSGAGPEEAVDCLEERFAL